MNGLQQAQLVRAVDRTFTLTPEQTAKFRGAAAGEAAPGAHQLQLACFQQNDGVPFRQHWPLGCAMEVNGVQYRVYGRAAYAKLGANQRDEPANVGLLCAAGAAGRTAGHCASHRRAR